MIIVMVGICLSVVICFGMAAMEMLLVLEAFGLKVDRELCIFFIELIFYEKIGIFFKLFSIHFPNTKTDN